MKNYYFTVIALLFSCFMTARSTYTGNEKEESGSAWQLIENGSDTANSFFTFGTLSPIGFSDINAQYISQGVRINWTSTDVESGSLFNIERSTDAIHFYSIGSLPGNSAGSFSYIDNDPLNGTGYYRIAYSDPRGKKTYSKTVNVQVISREALKAYYNGSLIKIALDLNTKGNYRIALINASGQVMLIKNINFDGSFNSFDLNPDSRLSYGIYSLIVKGEGASFSTQVLVK